MNRCTADETISRTTEFASGIGNGDRQDMRLRAKKSSCLNVLSFNKIGKFLPEIDLWCFAHNPRIHQLLPIGKIAKALQPERDKELLRSHKGMGRTAAWRPRPGSDQVARIQPPDQVTADLLSPCRRCP